MLLKRLICIFVVYVLLPEQKCVVYRLLNGASPVCVNGWLHKLCPTVLLAYPMQCKFAEPTGFSTFVDRSCRNHGCTA